MARLTGPKLKAQAAFTWTGDADRHFRPSPLRFHETKAPGLGLVDLATTRPERQWGRFAWPCRWQACRLHQPTFRGNTP